MGQTINDDFNTTKPMPLAPPQELDASAVLLLEDQVSHLKNICKLIDPYKEIPEEIKNELRKLSITQFYDPFQVTNKLLLQLEDAISALQAAKSEQSPQN